MSGDRRELLGGEPIRPGPVRGTETAAELVDSCFLAYNAGRLREACRLFVEKILPRGGLSGVSLSGALTPAGLGASCLVPLVEAGFVDWIVSTGANLYHDLHLGLGLSLHRGSPFVDDRRLKESGVVRIYDVLFPYEVLLDTDRFVREVLAAPEFQRDMGTAELHHLLGGYVARREEALGTTGSSLLAAAHRAGVPVFASAPGDSSIGMNLAALRLRGTGPRIDVARDVNETAALVWAAKQDGRTSGVILLGGGSPKNFVLQTEPHLQEVLGLAEAGHDYFLQITDARPDTGGLSGATPSEAVSWGKVDPARLPDAVVVYLDASVALPLLTAYVLAQAAPRPPKGLYHRREELVERMARAAGR